MADGTLVFDTKLDSTGMETGLSKVGSTAKNALGTVAKAGAAALAAGTTAAAALTKTAIDAFAEFEQLEGGAKLMFGDAYDFIMDKSAEAYKNVQMSQNDYLTQVNGLSVGLKTALKGDAQAAAELADKVVTAEADVISATGASQEAVQNAFNGIMKNNFSMLDNLQLGITPTKEGMKEVIDQVNKWNKANGEATKYQMGNLADMQAALVDYVKMQGMAGYAANEGASTIQGSLAATKAAWENLLSGMAKGDDLSQYIDNLLTTVENAFNNLLPVVEKSLQGIGGLIEKLAPVIAEKLPGLVDKVLPPLLNAATSLINGLVKALPTILNVLLNVLPGIVKSIGSTIMENLPMLIKVGAEMLVSLAQGLAEALPTLIPQIVDVVLDIVDTLLDNIDLLIDAGIQLMIGLTEGLMNALPRLIERIPDIIISIFDALVRYAPKLLDASLQLILMLGKGLIQAIPQLSRQVPKILGGIIESLMDGLPKIQEAGVNLIKGLGEGFSKARQWLINKVKQLCNDSLGAIKSFFGIASPSKKFMWIGEMCVEGMEEGLAGMEDLADGVTASLGNITANVSGGNVGGATNGGIAGAVAEVLEGMGVYMDGRSVGQVTAASVNDTLGRFALRRA